MEKRRSVAESKVQTSTHPPRGTRRDVFRFFTLVDVLRYLVGMPDWCEVGSIAIASSPHLFKDSSTGESPPRTWREAADYIARPTLRPTLSFETIEYFSRLTIPLTTDFSESIRQEKGSPEKTSLAHRLPLLKAMGIVKKNKLTPLHHYSDTNQASPLPSWRAER